MGSNSTKSSSEKYFIGKYIDNMLAKQSNAFDGLTIFTHFDMLMKLSDNFTRATNELNTHQNLWKYNLETGQMISRIYGFNLNFVYLVNYTPNGSNGNNAKNNEYFALTVSQNINQHTVSLSDTTHFVIPTKYCDILKYLFSPSTQKNIQRMTVVSQKYNEVIDLTCVHGTKKILILETVCISKQLTKQTLDTYTETLQNKINQLNHFLIEFQKTHEERINVLERKKILINNMTQNAMKHDIKNIHSEKIKNKNEIDIGIINTQINDLTEGLKRTMTDKNLQISKLQNIITSLNCPIPPINQSNQLNQSNQSNQLNQSNQSNQLNQLNQSNIPNSIQYLEYTELPTNKFVKRFIDYIKCQGRIINVNKLETIHDLLFCLDNLTNINEWTLTDISNDPHVDPIELKIECNKIFLNVKNRQIIWNNSKIIKLLSNLFSSCSLTLQSSKQINKSTLNSIANYANYEIEIYEKMMSQYTKEIEFYEKNHNKQKNIDMFHPIKFKNKYEERVTVFIINMKQLEKIIIIN